MYETGVTHNGSDGVYVRIGSARLPNLIEDNFTSHNADDGIDSDTPFVTIAGNKAIHNGDLGIETVPGATDGGGNKASANGNSAQCVNVSC